MNPEHHRPRRAGAIWLVSGIVAGGLATAALVLLIASAVIADPLNAGPAPTFVDETATAGLDHAYQGEFHFFVGGGVASFDCSGDRLPDLFLAGGSAPAALYRNESEIGGQLHFTQISGESTDLADVTGAYPLDVDSDGFTDLAVLRVGENVMLRGLGDCRFERANEQWGIDGGDQWTAAFSAQWEPGQEWPTLAFGNYVNLTEDGDTGEGCADSYMFRHSGERYGDPIELSPGWCTLSMLFSDWDRSGRRDLRLTNDRHYYQDGDEQLWRIEPDLAPRLYTEGDGWQPMKIWGMGIASQDLNGDGYPEVFLTSQGDNKLQTLADGGDRPAYRDIALAEGATAHRPFIGDTDRPSTAWHADFEDVNNDGLIDLFVSKGNVEAMPEFASDDPNNLLLGQPDGSFIEGAMDAGLLDFARSRGAALVDLNLDGLLDLVVVERREPVKVWRNTGAVSDSSAAEGNWIEVSLTQPGPNIDAIGSFVELRAGPITIEHEVTVGGGHAGGKLGWIHFGVGDAENARIRVRWPDGAVGPWLSVTVNGFQLVDRETSSAVTWAPLQD